MKKRSVVLALILTLLCGQVAHANMAAPAEADIGSAVTFEKNEEIAVTSEVLEITVRGAQADIEATYHMKNTTDQIVTTPSMFLSPNIEAGGVTILVDGEEAEYVAESYGLSWATNVRTDGPDWRYVVIDRADGGPEERTVDSLTFNLTFEPGEEFDVTVSYTYQLGGYPDYDFDAKRGEIEYYLTPAAMWKDFENLTITLHLDEDMPVITESNLAFKKIDKRTYQYVSDTLTEENMRVVIDENWIQNIFSTLRSPYLLMMLPIFAIPALIVLCLVGAIVLRLRGKKKKSGDQASYERTDET